MPIRRIKKEKHDIKTKEKFKLKYNTYDYSMK